MKQVFDRAINREQGTSAILGSSTRHRWKLSYFVHSQDWSDTLVLLQCLRLLKLVGSRLLSVYVLALDGKIVELLQAFQIVAGV